MIYFTRHAVEKFNILRRYSFDVSESSVVRTVTSPDLIDYSRMPLKIAQGNLDRNHVLRVVYREEGNKKIIITFYPGRKIQYEKRNKKN